MSNKMPFSMCVIRTYAIFVLFNMRTGNADNMIDETILGSLIPPTSHKCNASNAFEGSGTNYTFVHYSTDDFEHLWANISSGYEKEVFLAEMSHNDANANNSWTIRIGRGGNLYSFIGAYGEAIPPQYHKNAPFIDEVMQTVSINQEKNREDTRHPYFIHQAGAYMTDFFTENNPFYSPNVAKFCDGVVCKFGAWGQQAHIPTYHKSHVLYFNSYSNCGNGVLEFTSVIHNAASEDDGVKNTLSYFNVPWGGVRSTVFRDILISNPEGKLKRVFPPVSFENGVINLKDSGGFVTFTEELKSNDPPPLYQMPCMDKYSVVHSMCPRYGSAEKSDFKTLRLIVRGACQYQAHHSQAWNAYCVSMNIQTTFPVISGCKDCNLWFRNKRTDSFIHVDLVIHWSWAGQNIYFCPTDVSSDEINKQFLRNDEIIVSYANTGRSIENNLAFTYVHGHQKPLDGRWASSRIRYGDSGDVKRAYNVETLNARVFIEPGETYVSRQYIISGELGRMEESAKLWLDETYEDLFSLNELPSREIHLFSIDEHLFGTHVSNIDVPCACGVSRCAGASAPQHGKVPHFIITCGGEKYVGPDMYFFSPHPRIDEIDVRPYLCEGKPAHVRPQWRLLGFFAPGSCDFLKKASYDPYFCNVRSASATPSIYGQNETSSSPSLSNQMTN